MRRAVLVKAEGGGKSIRRVMAKNVSAKGSPMRMGCVWLVSVALGQAWLDSRALAPLPAITWAGRAFSVPHAWLLIASLFWPSDKISFALCPARPPFELRTCNKCCETIHYV